MVMLDGGNIILNAWRDAMRSYHSVLISSNFIIMFSLK